MTDKKQYPDLPSLGPQWTPYWEKVVHGLMINYADATCAMRAAQPETVAVTGPSDELLQRIAGAAYSFARRLEEGTRDAYRDECELIARRITTAFKAEIKALLTQPAPHPAGPSDADLEEMMLKCGARWAEKSFWRIEDADFHPALRSVLAKWGAAPTTQASQPQETAVSQGEPIAFTVAGNVRNWSRDFSKYKTQHYVRPVYAQPQEAAPRADAEDAAHIANLIEVARMPNAEYVADAHNDAVKHLRARAAAEVGRAMP